MFTAEHVAAGASSSFCLLEARLFQKGVFWGPQTPFTAEQVAAGASFLQKSHAFLKKVRFIIHWPYGGTLFISNHSFSSTALPD